jgi:integrase
MRYPGFSHPPGILWRDTMRAQMPYLQLWKGTYRVRKPVPKAIQPKIGRGQYLTRSLGTANRIEANRRAAAVLAEFQNIIDLARRDEWPPLSDEAIASIAHGWSCAMVDAVAEFFDPDEHPPILKTEKAFDRSVTNYLMKNCSDAHCTPAIFARVRQACLGETAVRKAWLPHESDFVKERPIPDFALRNVTATPVASSACFTFAQCIEAWAHEREVRPKTRDEFTAKSAKLIAYLGHDDMAAVKDTDIIGWKDTRIKSGASQKTIWNDLMAIKTLFNYAESNKKVASNPAKAVRFKAKRGPKMLGYSDADARLLLRAARREKSPKEAHRRWVPWLVAFTGARLEEVCGAAAADVSKFGRVWVLHIRRDNRETGAGLKNEGAERIIPLHPAIIDEGLLSYVQKLPKNGPLFPYLTPDRYGKRGGSGSKRLCRWVRETLRMTDPRKAPNHAWRHRFKSICRDAGIKEENHDAITGHSTGDVGRDYGEYFGGLPYREIKKIKSPVRLMPTSPPGPRP